MLSNNETNLNIVEIQQLQQQNNSTPSPEGSLEQKIESLGKEIKSLRKQNRLNSGIIGLGVIGLIGYIIVTNWSAIAPALVAAGTAIAAAAPVIGIAIGAIIGAAVLVGASYAIWKYRAQIKEGFKYAAEKTVDGAKHIGGKIKDGAVYAKDSVKEGYEHSVDSLKRGTHLVNKRAKEKVSNVLTATADKLYRAAGNENYSDRIDNELIPDSRQKKKVQGIKEDFRAIFANGEDNSTLIKSILSGISSKIAEKIAGETYLDFRDYLPNQEVDRWKEQKRFVDNLDASSLHDLITKRMLDKSKYFRDSIFSEHHDEIKEVIAKCKEDHILKGSLKMRNNMFYGDIEPSRSSSFSSVSSLGRKDSTQSTSSLSRSSSLDSVRTESTVSSEAELLNPAKHKEVKAPSSFREKMPSWLGGKKAPEETTNVKYQDLSEPGTLSRRVGESTFYFPPPKPPRSNSLNSIGTVSTDAVPGLGSDNFATVNPNRLRRSNSSSSLTPQLTPAAPPKVPGSASLPNLNGQSSFSDPTVKQNLDSLSNSVSSLASNDSHHGTTSELSGNDDSTVFKSSSLSDHNGSDSGFNSPNSSAPFTPERQGPSVKELLEQFDRLYKPNSLKSDVSVKGHTELNR